MKTRKNLSYDERLSIEKYLKERKSFKEIGRLLNRDCNCIRNEIKRHLIETKTVSKHRFFNNCIYRNNCKHSTRYQSCDETHHCSQYKKDHCDFLDNPPYCCNGCKDFVKCRISKLEYSADAAHKLYISNLSNSRKGITYTENELKQINDILYPLIVEQGQSIHHAYINNIDSLMCSEREIYILINSGYLTIKNIDLPRTVQRKKREKKNTTFKIDKKCRVNRKYSDFLEFKRKNKDLSIVEMDSVIGIKGGKCLLTLHIVNCNFMLAFIRDKNDSQSVIDIFNYLEKTLGIELFRKIFGIVLTDNGSEFSNPTRLEFNDNGEFRTNIFYCDPGHSEQKGSCENNHELIRRILPQGTSFDKLTQDNINLMMSHINSYKRKALNNCSPLQLFSTLYGRETAIKLSITYIKPNKIILNNNLFK